MKNWKIDLFSLSMFAFNIVQWRLSILRSVVNPWHCPKGSSLRPNKDIQQPFVRRTLAMGRKTVVKRDCFVFRNIWQCFAKCLLHVGWDIVWGYEVTHHVSACHGWHCEWGMVLNAFDSRQLQPPNSETWTKGPTSLSSLLKNDDQGVWRWYSTQWEDQGH